MKLRLTEARIPSLRTAKAQEDIFHEPTPGAGLRVNGCECPRLGACGARQQSGP